jgi:CelD/BcsL family acetyltransferase involved in cellulose biosynthesis
VTLLVERVRSIEALMALEPEWESLEAQSGPQMPFTGALWSRLWMEHKAATRWSVSDEVYAFAVRERDGRLVAIAPMMRTTRPAIGPFRIRMIQFIGADPNMTELRRMVCRPDDEARAAHAILDALVTDERDWDLVEWTGLLSPDSVASRKLSIHERDAVPMYFVRLPSSWDEFRSGLSRNIKESLRKCYNSLRRDAVNWTFRAVDSPSEIGAALDRFFVLHSARAEAIAAVHHKDVFASEARRAFLHEYFGTMAQEGRAFAFQLLIDDVVIATRLAVACGTTLYFYYSGFDASWGKYSVMTTTLAEALKWSIERNFEVANLSTGTDVSKTRWGPEVVLFHARCLYAPSLRSRLSMKLYLAVRRLKGGAWFDLRGLGRE